jgi:diguanylate cyclase (GGDEF)-like protein/PAS domain S-box-containing protein
VKHWSPREDTSSAILQLIAEHSSDVFALVRPDMTFSYVSPSCDRLFVRPASEVVGRHVSDFILAEDLPLLAEATRQVMAGTTTKVTVTLRVIRGDGTLLWVEVASRLIGESELGQPGDRAVILRDVSERRALEDELRAMAMKDGLTGLANRRAFDEALVVEWKRMVRAKSHMSLLLIDVDNFKSFNDAYGHQVGDDCLRSIGAALVSAACRPGDVVSRYGGEELAIILAGADAAAAATVAERARHAVAALAIPNGLHDDRVVTVSVGAATALVREGGSAKLPEALLSSADRALYAAKDAGRNRYCTGVLLVTA